MKVRAGAAAAVAALVMLGVAACAPITTLKPYDPSDGVSATVGQVKVLNALVLTKSGVDGNLLFSAYNPTDQPIQLNVQFDDGSTRTTAHAALPANATSDFGYGKKGQFLLPGLGVEAGSLAQIYFQYGDEPGKQVTVPVLDGAQPQYADLLPTPTPTPVLTAGPVTPAPSPTPTP